MNPTRTRYQQGSLTTEKRKNGEELWVYRWREIGINGKSTRRKKIVGTKSQFPSKSAAMRQVEGLRLDINRTSTSGTNEALTIEQLVEHYKLIELAEDSDKSARTKDVYRQHLNDFILPMWGSKHIGEIRAFAVEAWLKTLSYAPGTKAKTRNIFSALYQHAMRFGWLTRNPIREVRQSSKRQQEPEVLSPEEVISLLAELPEPSRTMVLIAVVTGLRRGELFGLKWCEVDFEQHQLRITRSVVDQVIGETKTTGSKRPLPMPMEMTTALRGWREATPYKRGEDWVFASPQSGGRNPLWPNTVLERHVKPAAIRAGITKKVSWHTFRRTFATLLLSSGATVKTAQELMRHASPTMTLGTYAQAVNIEKREAQAVVANLFNPAETELRTSVSA